MVLSWATADDSLAFCWERSRLGTAIIAIIRMIATTIINSSSEKPSRSFIRLFILLISVNSFFSTGAANSVPPYGAWLRGHRRLTPNIASRYPYPYPFETLGLHQNERQK